MCSQAEYVWSVLAHGYMVAMPQNKSKYFLAGIQTYTADVWLLTDVTAALYAC